MKATEIQRELRKVDTNLAALESWRDRLEQARKALLLVADDRDRQAISAIKHGLGPGDLLTIHDPDVRQLLSGWKGQGLHSIDGEIAELRERRELLEEQLPSTEEVAKAETRAAKLIERVEQVECVGAWAEFMDALVAAEVAARKVVETHNEARTVLGELSSLVEQYALDVEVPREPRPKPADSKMAGLLGSLLRDVGHSQVIDGQLDGELVSARRQVEREAA